MRDSKVIENFIFNLAYQMMSLLLPIITTPYLSRRLGAEGVGTYQYVYTIVSYFTMCCILGIENYGSRECAAVRDDSRKLAQKFREIYTVQLCASIVTIAAYILFTVLDGEIRTLLICQFMFLPAYMLDITWLYYGLEQFKKVVIRNMFIKLLTVVLIFVFVRDEKSLPVYCLLMSGTTLVSQLVLWPGTIRFLSGAENVYKKKNNIYVMVKKSLKEHARPILALFFSIAGVNIYINIDKLMLGNMLDMSSVGIYTYSENLAKLPYGIVTALTAVMLPRIARLLAGNDIEGGRRAASETMNVTMYIALPVCMGIAAIADMLIPWYYSDEFLMCIPVTRLLIVIILLIAWSGVVTSQCLVPMKRDKELVYASVIAAVVNVAANVILIPPLGIYGAVAGTVLTELIVAVYKTWCARTMLIFSDIFGQVWKYAAAAVIMGVAVWYVGSRMGRATPVVTFIQIIIGAIVYIMCTAPLLMAKKKS